MNESTERSRYLRIRSKNFTDAEKERFLSICLSYKTTLENKRTDKMACEEKLEAWENIACKYNAIQTTGKREIKSLKMLYDNLKMKAKREEIEGKKEVYKTDSATFKAIMAQLLSPTVDELPEHQLKPLENTNDSSSSFYSEGMYRNSNQDKETVLFDKGEKNPELNIKNYHHAEITGELQHNTSQTKLNSPTNQDKQTVVFYEEEPELRLKNNNHSEITKELKQNNNKTKLNSPSPSTALSISPAPKRKHTDAYIKSHDESIDFKRAKLLFLEEEHSKKMEILEIEREVAAANLRNKLLKEQILDLQLSNMGYVEKIS